MNDLTEPFINGMPFVRHMLNLTFIKNHHGWMRRLSYGCEMNADSVTI